MSGFCMIILLFCVGGGGGSEEAILGHNEVGILAQEREVRG